MIQSPEFYPGTSQLQLRAPLTYFVRTELLNDNPPTITKISSSLLTLSALRDRSDSKPERIPRAVAQHVWRMYVELRAMRVVSELTSLCFSRTTAAV